MYDMFIGGVCSSGEGPADTLLRELNEEAGLDFSIIDTNTNNDSSLKKKKRDIEIPWVSPEADKAWQQFKQSPSYLRLFPSSSSSSSLSSSTTTNNNNSNSNCLKYIKKCRIKTSLNYCTVYLYIAICSTKMEASLQFRDGEIQQGKWTSLEELLEDIKVNEILYVPDGMQVWNALIKI